MDLFPPAHDHAQITVAMAVCDHTTPAMTQRNKTVDNSITRRVNGLVWLIGQ